MNHEYFEELIFREAELSEEERAELAAHLSECGDCAAFRKDWIALSGLIESEPFTVPAPGFVVRFENVRARSGMAQRNRWNLEPTSFVLTAVLILTFTAANIALISNHVYLSLLIRTAELYSKAAILIECIQYALNQLRVPLLILGLGALSSSIVLGLIILSGYRLIRRKEERGI